MAEIHRVQIHGAKRTVHWRKCRLGSFEDYFINQLVWGDFYMTRDALYEY